MPRFTDGAAIEVGPEEAGVRRARSGYRRVLVRSLPTSTRPELVSRFRRFKSAAHLCCALITQIAVLLHSFVDHLREFRWNRGVQSNGIDRILVQDFVKNRAGTVALERKNAGGHFVEHAAKENRSLRASNSLPRTCSGDMYKTVPSAVPGLVN